MKKYKPYIVSALIALAVGGLSAIATNGNMDIYSELEQIKKRVELLKGINVLIKVNEGRNKIIDYVGKVESVYPSVFTFKTEDENIKTFPYADVLTKNIKFFKN